MCKKYPELFNKIQKIFYSPNLFCQIESRPYRIETWADWGTTSNFFNRFSCRGAIDSKYLPQNGYFSFRKTKKSHSNKASMILSQ